MLSEVFSSLAPLRATSSAMPEYLARLAELSRKVCLVLVPALICLYYTTDVNENRVSQLPRETNEERTFSCIAGGDCCPRKWD